MPDETTPPTPPVPPVPEQPAESTSPTPAPAPPLPGQAATAAARCTATGWSQPASFPRATSRSRAASDRRTPAAPPPQLRDFAANKPNNRELDAMIEDELNQAMAGFAIETEVAQTETQQKPQSAGGTPGQRKKGRIVSIHGKDVFVEVPGGRSQGVLPLQQFEGRTPAIGEEVEFDIERYDAANGLLVLTREGAAQTVTDWSSVALHMIVEARVTGTNKNKTGLTVEVNGIKGFLPASQLDLYRVEDLDQFLNQRLKVQVVELNPEERNLIVSRRAMLERERAQKAEQFWTTIAEGQIRKGIVKSIKPFGAFVDLGGADGLIPVSEFSWQRVNDLNEFVKIGQEVEVMVVARRSRGAEDRPERQATHDQPVRRVRDPREGRRATHRQGDADRRLRRVRGTRAGHRGADPRLRTLDPARPPRSRRRPGGPVGRGRGAER